MGRMFFICILYLQSWHPGFSRYLPVDPAALRLAGHPSILFSI